MKCGHVFHVDCVKELLNHKWSTLRITFAFMSCPSCKAPIEVDQDSEIADQIAQLKELRVQILEKAMKVVEM